MQQQLRVERGNILVSKKISVEPGALPEMVVFHIFMEDPQGVLHQVSFAARMNHGKGVIKAFKRLAPVRPEEEKRKGMDTDAAAAAEKGGCDAPGTRICMDQSDRPGAGQTEGSADEMGAGFSGQAPVAVPGPEGDAPCEPEPVAGDRGDRG